MYTSNKVTVTEENRRYKKSMNIHIYTYRSMRKKIGA